VPRPAQPRPPRLTPLELDIMTALWDRGRSTVAEVQQALTRRPPLAYTTVQTVLNILARKGHATRELSGKAYAYSPAVSRSRAVARTLQELVDKLFAGSPTDLVMTLVHDRRFSRKELHRLRQLIDDHDHDAR
jgi:BlaI family transcriptional regulator, penicillinase repressor